MKNPFHRYSKYTFIFCFLIVALFAIQWWGGNGFLTPGKVEAKITPETVPFEEPAIFDKANPNIRAVMAVQERNTPGLMGLPEVVGTATGLTEDDRPAILVLTKKGVGPGAIPESIEGVPVVVMVTGEIFSMEPPSWAGGGSGKGKGERIDPTSRFDRPVPIGVSTGNAGECSAGTIGARVKKPDGSVYALSNNHVYALENKASLGSVVLQPGRYDTNCAIDPENAIGTLSAYVPISFVGINSVDAAIALSTIDDLGNATPLNGYGKPKSTIFEGEIEIGLPVQKYGRTSSLTKGSIGGFNGIFNVSYQSGTALFVNQIVVRARKPFIKPGDSGSLLVTDPDRFPVGLLFAGTPDGKTAIANPIGAVLTRFGVTIDGEIEEE